MIKEIIWNGTNINEFKEYLKYLGIYKVQNYKLFYSDIDILHIQDHVGNHYYIEKDCIIRFSKDKLCSIPYFIYCPDKSILYFDVNDYSKITYSIKDRW